MTLSDRHFATLIREHGGAVVAYARATAPDHWVADDAVQETFLRAWRYRDSFQGSGSFEGWLVRICRNCLVDLVSRRVDEPMPNTPDVAEVVPDPIELYDLIARLPLHQREVIALCGLLGYDYAGTAELLGVPIGTVRSRMHRARAALAELVDDSAAEVSR